MGVGVKVGEKELGVGKESCSCNKKNITGAGGSREDEAAEKNNNPDTIMM